LYLRVVISFSFFIIAYRFYNNVYIYLHILGAHAKFYKNEYFLWHL
jgi:hypothetical protein